MEFYRMKEFASRLLTFALACALAATAFAQQQPLTPSAQTKPQAVDEEDVVRITANLVQLDAVVTDKSGRQITDLRAEDFEVLEDGRQQQLTNVSYVSLDRRALPNANASATTAKTPPSTNAPSAPNVPMPLRPNQVRRTIALVVDDLGLS